MSNELKFFVTADFRSLIERHKIPMELFKINSDGVGTLKSQTASKVEALMELVSRKKDSDPALQKLVAVTRGYLESIDNGEHVDVEADFRIADSGDTCRAFIIFRAGHKMKDLSVNYPNIDTNPANCAKLSKFYPIVHLFTNESSPFYDEDFCKRALWFHVREQLVTQIKRSAELGKAVRSVVKELLKDYKPEPKNLVDLLMAGEEEVIKLIKKHVNVARPIEINITRHQISHEERNGYQVLISFAAGGKNSTYILTALKGYREPDLYAVILGDHKGNSPTKEFLTEKWMCRRFPGRSEDEFKEIMVRYGLREVKSSAEKKFTELASALQDYKVKTKDEDFVITRYKHWEMNRLGSGDPFYLDNSREDKIEKDLQSAAKIAQASGIKLTASFSFSEIDYRSGCNTYWIPSFSVIKNKYIKDRRDSNSTPKGWLVEVEVNLEVPKKYDIKKVQEIVSLLNSAVSYMD